MDKDVEQPAVLAMLEKILNRLDEQDRRISALASGREEAKSTELEMKMRLLDRLTIKRHAVLTATLGNLSYQQIAALMNCSVTTVKLFLRNGLQILDIGSRALLLTNHAKMLDDIPEKVYQNRYGIAKKWWLTMNPEVMSQIVAAKGAANQHTTGDHHEGID